MRVGGRVWCKFGHVPRGFRWVETLELYREVSDRRYQRPGWIAAARDQLETIEADGAGLLARLVLASSADAWGPLDRSRWQGVS